MSPIQEKIIDLLTQCAAAADREPLWPPLVDAIRECAGAESAELATLSPSRTLASSGSAQATHTVILTLVASGRRRGLLTLRFLDPAASYELPPGALATLAVVLSDEANIRDMRKLVEGAAHDLRGAFVRFNTFSQLFTLESTPNPAQEEVFGHMKRNLESVDILLRDLYAYVSAPVSSNPACSVQDAFENAQWRLKRELQESGAHVHFEGADQRVRMPEEELAEVIRRLVENSIKFGNGSSRTIVSAAAADSNVRIDVTDSGPGVDPDYRETIFEPFQRLHSKQIPGHGLGLAICRKKVEAAGGLLWAEPATPSGLCLKILVPRA